MIVPIFAPATNNSQFLKMFVKAVKLKRSSIPTRLKQPVVIAEFTFGHSLIKLTVRREVGMETSSEDRLKIQHFWKKITLAQVAYRPP